MKTYLAFDEIIWLAIITLIVATGIVLLVVVLAHAELSGIVGIQDNRTNLNLTVQTKDKPLTAALELPTRQVWYGFRADADWLRGHYYWSPPASTETPLLGVNFLGKVDDRAFFSGRRGRSQEWEFAADLTTYVNEGWRTPIRPYVGYGRSSTGWHFSAQEAKDGQIDLAWTQQVTFVGLAFLPRQVPIRAEIDYGWTRTVLGGNRQSEKELTRIDGTLKGNRWHAGVAAEWPVTSRDIGIWLGLVADWYQTTGAGDLNHTKDKDTFPGSGSMDSREWKVSGEVKARW